MTQRELLVSTVQFYTSENRGTVPNSKACMYSKSDTSPGCAIGRFLPENVQKIFDKPDNGNYILGVEEIFENPDFVEMLPDWMLEIGEDFLSRIQSLHDSEFKWDSFGINNVGKTAVNLICSDFNLEPLTEEEFKHEECN